MFIFGGDTGVTHEQLTRRRALADQMTAAASRRPTDIGSGINSAMGSIAGALLGRSADQGLEEGRDQFSEQYQNTVNAFDPITQQLATPPAPQATQAQEAPSPVPTQGPRFGEIASLLASPYASDAERDVLSLLLEQQFPDAGMSEYQRSRLDLDERKLQAQLDGRLQTGTTVNVGGQGAPRTITAKPQPGYMHVPDGRGGYVAEVIPGGSVDREMQAAKDAAVVADENKLQSGGIVSEDIDRALAMVSESPTWTTGLAGQLLSGIGGTGARDLDAVLTTIRANIGFDQLQKMREASPTGGALGNVTERELANLQAVLGNLETSQGSDQLSYNLERLGKLYDNIMFKLSGYPGRENAGLDARQAAQLRKDRNRRNAVEIDGYTIEEVE
ncbi:MAG: hypothetical protein AAGI03_02735 [Pseudomonadota bacterium]